jgi:hypothetical protein
VHSVEEDKGREEERVQSMMRGGFISGNSNNKKLVGAINEGLSSMWPKTFELSDIL